MEKSIKQWFLTNRLSMIRMSVSFMTQHFKTYDRNSFLLNLVLPIPDQDVQWDLVWYVFIIFNSGNCLTISILPHSPCSQCCRCVALAHFEPDPLCAPHTRGMSETIQHSPSPPSRPLLALLQPTQLSFRSKCNTPYMHINTNAFYTTKPKRS